jgi:hypothetical protein
VKRRRRRQNPGIFGGAGDAELIGTLAIVGLGVWLAWAVYQGAANAASSVESGISAALDDVIGAPGRALTAVEDWWGGETTMDLGTGNVGSPPSGSTVYDLSTGMPVQ